MIQNTADADAIDLRSRVVGLEGREAERLQRISALETWKHQTEIQEARKDEQLKGMEARIDARFSSVEKAINDTHKLMNGRLDQMGGNITWLVRIAVGSILGGAVTLALHAFGVSLP